MGHSDRVSYYAAAIARRLGRAAACCEQIRVAGLFHDVGKLSVPDEILLKPTSLTDEEYEIIKTHSRKGTDILSALTQFRPILPAVLSHHERYDGRGYNEHLAGEDIPLYARIISVADAFDAMNSTRVYRPGMTTDFILSEIERGKGSQFDPVFAQILLDMIQDGFTA